MEQVEYEMVLECSGNGRSQYRGTPGTPWGHGGVANVRFGGVPLSAVLDRHGVPVDPRARYVTAEGQGTPTGPDDPSSSTACRSATSCEEHPRPDAERRATPRHPRRSGPPRDAGLLRRHATQVAQAAALRDLRVADLLSRDRVPGPAVPVQPGKPFEFTLENSRPTWSIRLMSYILDPLPGANLRPARSRSAAWRTTTGRRPSKSVAVSVDRGATWQSAGLETPDSSYAWYPWTARRTLEPGVHRSGRGPRTGLAAPSHSTARSTGTRTATSGPACSRRTSPSSDRPAPADGLDGAEMETMRR